MRPICDPRRVRQLPLEVASQASRALRLMQRFGPFLKISSPCFSASRGHLSDRHSERLSMARTPRMTSSTLWSVGFMGGIGVPCCYVTDAARPRGCGRAGLASALLRADAGGRADAPLHSRHARRRRVRHREAVRARRRPVRACGDGVRHGASPSGTGRRCSSAVPPVAANGAQDQGRATEGFGAASHPPRSNSGKWHRCAPVLAGTISRAIARALRVCRPSNCGQRSTFVARRAAQPTCAEPQLLGCSGPSARAGPGCQPLERDLVMSDGPYGSS